MRKPYVRDAVPVKGRRYANFLDRTGTRFGRLVAIEWAGSANGRQWWKCICDCGNHTISDFGHKKSCGCLQREAYEKGRAVVKAKTQANRELMGGDSRSLRQLAKAFKIKEATLDARMRRWPGRPDKWKRPVRNRRSKREKPLA